MTRKRSRNPVCAKCFAGYPVRLLPVKRGWLCEKCMDLTYENDDTTTNALRLDLMAQRMRADARRQRARTDPKAAAEMERAAADFAQQAMELKGRVPPAEIALGEVAPQGSWLTDTLADPGLAAVNASEHRSDLLIRLGTNCAALALDAADSAGAANSLEKMLCHQLAVAHKTSLEIIEKAFFEQEPTEKAKLMLVAARFMDTYQRGMLVLQRIKTGGDQRIVVQHVDVRGGGQAVIGNVSAQGCEQK